MPFGRPEMLARLVGTMRPLAVAEILRRYGSRAAFLRRFAEAARAQAVERFLLPEDAELLIHEAPRRWRG
jgi:hypothetical protein